MTADQMLRVLGLSGSSRSGSFNVALLNTAADLAPQGMKIEQVSLDPLPMYHADLEARGMPAPVVDLRRELAAADALLFSTPEYNGSTTPLLKNAIDWASRGGSDSPLRGKPVAITGAGGRFGTLRAQLHLREILTWTGARVLGRPAVYVDRPRHKVRDGRFVDERVRGQIGRLLEALELETRGALLPSS